MASAIVMLQGTITAAGAAPIVPTGTPVPGTRRWKFKVTQDSAVAGDENITVTLTDFLKKISQGTAAQKAARASVTVEPLDAATHTAAVFVDLTNIGTGSFVCKCTGASGVPDYNVVVDFAHSIDE